jgi:tetratricopeptide (TPR) repeat protein
MRWNALLLVVFLAASASAQHHFHYPRAEAGRVTVVKDVEFRPGLRYDLYRPAGNAVVPLLIVANLGSLQYRGWTIYQGWGDAVASSGVAAVVYDATQPTALADFDALMNALRQRASELRIDPSRVVLWSASANVQIGLPLAMDRARDYIRGAVLYYGSGNADEIRTDLPVLFVRAGLDTPQLNSDIDRLIARALAANAPWSIENNGSGLHGFEAQNDNEITRATIDRTLAFVKLVTRPEMSTAFAAGADDASAGAAFNRGDWPASVEAYRKRVAANPSDAESHRRLGIALFETKQYAASLTELETSWQHGRRGTRDIAYPAFKAAAAAGNEDRAVHWLELVVTGFAPPMEEIRAHATTAKLQQFLTDYEALEKGTSRAALSKLQEPSLVAHAYRLLGRDQTAEAIEVFRVATERYPKSANAWESLSEAYEKARDHRQALRAARKALELIPQDATLGDHARDTVRNAAEQRITRLTKKG